MDPYAWTWLSQHGGMLWLLVLWAGTMGLASLRGQWIRASVLGIGVWLGVAWVQAELLPLWMGEYLPVLRGAWQLWWVGSFGVGAALLGLLPRRRAVPFDAACLVAVGLTAFGVPGAVLAIMLLATGALAPGRRRGWVVAAVVLMGAAGVLQAVRVEALAMLGGMLSLSTDATVRLLGVVTSLLLGGGWTLLTAWWADQASLLRPQHAEGQRYSASTGSKLQSSAAEAASHSRKASSAHSASHHAMAGSGKVTQ